MDQPSNLSLDYLDLLPDEILLEILLKTNDLDTLSRWCQASKRINRICQDKTLWKQKYLKDYGEEDLFEGDSWKRLYKRKVYSKTNSPISAGADNYGIIDQKGNLYMSGQINKLGIGPQMLASSNKLHLVTFPQKTKSNNITSLPTKIVNISVSWRSVGAVTLDGRVFIWGYEFCKVRKPYTIPKKCLPVIYRPREILLPEGMKAIKIQVSSQGYIILLENSSVYISTVYMNIPRLLNLKAIDVSTASGIYVIITKNNEALVGGNIFTNESNNDNELVALNFPKPIKRVVLGIDYIMVLSTTGEVYTQLINKPFSAHGGLNEIFTKTSTVLVKLPEVIVQISHKGAALGATFLALSETGKLYMWGNNTDNKIGSNNQGFDAPWKRHASGLLKISFGLPINFVSVGSNFIIAVSNDRKVNFWGASYMKPE